MIFFVNKRCNIRRCFIKMSFIIKFFREFRIVYVDKVIIFCIVFFMVGISYIVIIIE